MTNNSVIIAHLNRETHLDKCLRSIKESAAETGISDFEVVVAGHIEETAFVRFHANYSFLRYIQCETTPPSLMLYPGEFPPFWKNHCLNCGIEEATGKILTFLDADIMVGPKFLLNAQFLYASNLTRLCYRVRNVPENEKPDFSKYDQYKLTYEAYGRVDDDRQNNRIPPVFGGSKFSCRKDSGIICDENYWGRGHEDLSMIRALSESYGDADLATIITHSDYALLHIDHEHEKQSGFDIGRWSRRNERRFYNRKTLWIVNESAKLLEHSQSVVQQGTQGLHAEYMTSGDWKYRECEKNEFDTVLLSPTKDDIANALTKE